MQSRGDIAAEDLTQSCCWRQGLPRSGGRRGRRGKEGGESSRLRPSGVGVNGSQRRRGGCPSGGDGAIVMASVGSKVLSLVPGSYLGDDVVIR